MTRENEIRFKIEEKDAESIPMIRLAKYLSDLANVLGEHENVHLVRLERGSTVLVQAIKDESLEAVQSRMKSVLDKSASSDVMDAFEKFNRNLINDNVSGSLYTSDHRIEIACPSEYENQSSIEATREPDYIDGIVIGVGGRDNMVPVHLQNRNVIHICTATRETAKSLAPYLFGTVLRVHGKGRWQQSATGGWNMKQFVIQQFEEIDTSPLSTVVDRLRSVEGSGWADIEDPVAELERIRNL